MSPIYEDPCPDTERLPPSESKRGRVVTLQPDGAFQGVGSIDQLEDELATIYVGAALAGGTEPAAADVTDLVLQISFGTGGGGALAEVDVQQGSRICLSARTIELALRTENATPGAAALQLGVFVSRGATGLPNAAHRTMRLGALPAGAASAAVRVPNFATKVSVYRDPFLPIRLTFQDRAAPPLVLGHVDAALNGNLWGAVLPHDCCYVVLTNQHGINQLNLARIVFELEL